MKIVVVRHAERVDTSDASPITEAGKADAMTTGTWLKQQGIQPVLVLTTRRLRTKQTAEGLLTSFPGVPVRERTQGIAKTRDGWVGLVSDLVAMVTGPNEDGDVVLVAHGVTQDLVKKHFDGERFGVPDENRCAAFILEVEKTPPWSARCVDAWPGQVERQNPKKVPR